MNEGRDKAIKVDNNKNVIARFSVHKVVSEAIIVGLIHDFVNMISFGLMLLSLLYHLFGQPEWRTLPRSYGNGHHQVFCHQHSVRLQGMVSKVLKQEDWSMVEEWPGRLGSRFSWNVYRSAVVILVDGTWNREFLSTSIRQDLGSW